MNDIAGSREFDGRVAIVSGAGSGVGLATAELLAVQGAHLVLADIREDRLADAERSLRAMGAEVATVAADLRSEDDVVAVVSAAVDGFGGIDVLCNNVGVAGQREPVPTWKVSDDDWDRVFETNLRSAFYMVRHSAAALIESGGCIVNTASAAGVVVWGSPIYGASKAALIHLTRGLSVEFAPYEVRVNCVCPGVIRTNFGEGMVRRKESVNIQSTIPLERVAEAKEIAETIVFLASPRSSYTTGAAFVVDGGHCVL